MIIVRTKRIMINTYKVNRKVRSAYEKNQFIYSIAKIPFLGDLVTNKAYSSKTIKTLFAIKNFIGSIIKLFVWKVLYLFIVVALSGAAYKNIINKNLNKPVITGKIFFVLIILSIIGGFINNTITNVMSETYSSIMILRMDAKKYAISNYIAFLIHYFIGSVIASAIVCLNIKYYPLYMILFYPLCSVLIKIIVASYSVKKQSENLFKDNLITYSWFLVMVACIVCIMIASTGFIVLKPPALILIVVSLVILPVSISSWKYLVYFENYKYIYKKLIFDSKLNEGKSKANKVEIDNYSKMLDINLSHEMKTGAESSDKKGYEFFNDVFIKRHRSIFYKHCLICSVIILAIFVLLTLIGVIFRDKDYLKMMRGLVDQHSCAFLFVLYIVNRGEAFTKAYFYNCDCSMLTYNFYRKKETVINLFMIRLKSIIKYNMIPTIIIAIGVDVLYFIASGKKTIFYIITPISILAMGIFFSIHYIFLYYIMQPFNEKLENKNYIYGLCTSMTYMVCYIIYNKKINSLLFCPIMIGFTIIYVIMAYIVINTVGYKRFKLNS